MQKTITSIMSLFLERIMPSELPTLLSVNSPIAGNIGIKNLQHKLKIAELEAADYKQSM